MTTTPTQARAKIKTDEVIVTVGCGCDIPRLEDCKKLGFPRGCYHADQHLKDVLDELIVATIERCAQVADKMAATPGYKVAAAIRELKDKPNAK